jgi:hypothetical protein
MEDNSNRKNITTGIISSNLIGFNSEDLGSYVTRSTTSCVEVVLGADELCES